MPAFIRLFHSVNKSTRCPVCRCGHGGMSSIPRARQGAPIGRRTGLNFPELWKWLTTTPKPPYDKKQPPAAHRENLKANLPGAA
jgi:hypothetical protein